MQQFVTILLLCLTPVICFAQSDNAEHTAVEKAVKKLKSLEASVSYNSDGDVESVWFSEDTSAEHLQLLAGMNHLEKLSVANMDLGSDGLKSIESLESLKEFSAYGKPFGDAQVLHLTRLRELEVLDLSGTAVTDASIEIFSSFKKLRVIDLQKTSVTAKGFSKLRASQPDLEILQHWKYYCGFQDGRALLEIGRVFIFFPDKDMKGEAIGGGGGGGRVRVSRSSNERHYTKKSGGGGLLNRISVSVKQEKDGPAFSIEDHSIEIRKEGTELIIDGESFPIPENYLSVTIDSNGVGKPQPHDKRPLPERKSIFDDADEDQ